MIHQNPSNPISLVHLVNRGAYSPLSRDAEALLVYKARKGNKVAKEKLFRSASNALVQVARKSSSFAKRSGFDIDELVAIGYSAFDRAIVDFKPSLKAPFSGFLYKCALFKILEEVRKYRTAITLPKPNNLSPASKSAWEGASRMISIDERMDNNENFDIPARGKVETEPKTDRARLQMIAKAAAGIAPRKKEVFRLYYGINAAGKVGDYINSCNDIASRLGIASSSIRSNLWLAKKQIQGICNGSPSHANGHRIRMNQVHFLKKHGWTSLGRGKWAKKGIGIESFGQAWEQENANKLAVSRNPLAYELESNGTRSRFPRRAQG